MQHLVPLCTFFLLFISTILPVSNYSADDMSQDVDGLVLNILFKNLKTYNLNKYDAISVSSMNLGDSVDCSSKLQSLHIWVKLFPVQVSELIHPFFSSLSPLFFINLIQLLPLQTKYLLCTSLTFQCPYNNCFKHSDFSLRTWFS